MSFALVTGYTVSGSRPHVLSIPIRRGCAQAAKRPTCASGRTHRPDTDPIGRKSRHLAGACVGQVAGLEFRWPRPQGGAYGIVAGCPGGVLQKRNKAPGDSMCGVSSLEPKKRKIFENIKLNQRPGIDNGQRFARRLAARSAVGALATPCGRFDLTIKEIMTRLQIK